MTNTIIIIFSIIFLFIILHKFFRTQCYDFWNGHSAINNYKHIFNKINPNSIILDVGVGTGINLIHNKQTILNKKLFIHGIDVDKQYNEQCKDAIFKNNLNSNISIELIDLLDVKKKYDYIIFVQSFPVIERNLMTKMLKHAQTLLNENGKIVFIHNLVDKDADMDNILYKIKPFIKYIPLVWIDSGKATKKSDFEQWLSSNQLVFSDEIIHTVDFFNINTYLYICELK